MCLLLHVIKKTFKYHTPKISFTNKKYIVAKNETYCQKKYPTPKKTPEYQYLKRWGI